MADYQDAQFCARLIINVQPIGAAAEHVLQLVDLHAVGNGVILTDLRSPGKFPAIRQGTILCYVESHDAVVGRVVDQ